MIELRNTLDIFEAVATAVNDISMPNDLISINITADTVAWYGASIATAVAFFQLYSLIRDRAKIKVKASESYLAIGGELEDNLNISIEAINIGRRRVTLTAAGFSLKGNKHIALYKPRFIKFPYDLDAGKSVNVFFNKKELQEDLLKNKSKIKRAWYRDATGRIYSKRYKLDPKNT